MLMFKRCVNCLRAPFLRLMKDEDGATLLEYTVLLVIILGGAITFIILAGDWVSGEWQSLMNALPPA